MKEKWDINTYFSYLNIPDTWDSLENFADWYMESKMPIKIPENSRVYTNENATSIILFRHDCYQVELYIGFPSTTVEEHFHPGIDIITMQIGSMNSDSIIWGAYTDTLVSGQSHTANFSSPKGSVFITFEKWYDKNSMSSASANWVGNTAGPKHTAIIKEHHPNVFINGSYADISIND